MGLKLGSIGVTLLLAGAYAFARGPEGQAAPCAAPANHSISTDAPGHLDKDCVRLSKKMKHAIVWKARHGKLEALVFENTNEPQKRPPFASCSEMPCVVACDGNGECRSGEINPALEPPDDPDAEKRGYRYNYRPQWAGSKKASLDPKVMIDP